jgi:hypothetical protein
MSMITVAGSLILAGLLAGNALWAAEQQESVKKFTPPDTAMAIVSRYRALFTKPPTNVPSDTSIDAPLMGNGDTLVRWASFPEKKACRPGRWPQTTIQSTPPDCRYASGGVDDPFPPGTENPRVRWRGGGATLKWLDERAWIGFRLTVYGKCRLKPLGEL